MKLLKWNESFAVNIRIVDMQHKALVEIINEYREAINDFRGSEVVLKILDKLDIYAQDHFYTEEQIMEKYNFSGLKSHVAEHKIFLAKLRSFYHKIEEDKTGMVKDLSNFLTEWFVGHVCDTDKDFADFVRMRGEI